MKTENRLRQARFEDYALSPDGSLLALVHRGKTFTMGNWEGPSLQHGVRNGVRYRLTRWLKDGKRIVLVSDEGGEDHLELQWTDGSSQPHKLTELDLGRPQEIKVSPVRDEIAITNHRHELIWVDLDAGTQKDRTKPLWSPGWLRLVARW